MKKAVIIVAAGAGRRMNTNIPKQFIRIANKTILQHTLEKFYSYDNTIKILIVLSEDYIDYWKQICMEDKINIKHDIVKGGAERFFSVQNALNKLDNTDLVAIHDAVRPFVNLQTIATTFSVAQQNNSAIPYIDTIDSLRIIEDNSSKPIDRQKIKIIQTPQVFNCEMIKQAYNQKYNPYFTDDASVFEEAGNIISLCNGNRNNIKITSQEDLIFAEFYINKNK